MPIYEYECEACAHHLEALQKFSDEPIRKCPKCSQDRLRKLVSATSFQLKGTGWYVTDIRDKDKAKSNKTDETGSPVETVKTDASALPVKKDKSADSSSQPTE